MTERQVARQIINELLRQIQIKEIENNYLNNSLTDAELCEIKGLQTIKPNKYKKEDLEQIIRTVIKLTGNHNMTADQIAYLINVDKGDVLTVYN